MNEITSKLYDQVVNDFYPIAEEMAKAGKSKDEIVNVFRTQLDLKTKTYYKDPKDLTSMKFVFKDIFNEIEKQNADSKAEKIFYDLLIRRGLKFQFQRAIGPYRADYLFQGFLIVELDGPQHDLEHDKKRDNYLTRLGYKVIRIPLWILISYPDAVLDEIEAELNTTAQGIKR